MSGFIRAGAKSTQLVSIKLDDYITEENEVIVVNDFIDGLDLSVLLRNQATRVVQATTQP